MKSSVTQGTSGLYILRNEAEPDETNNAAIDAGLYYIDQDSGVAYTREATEGDEDNDGEWVSRGKVIPFVGDQADPATPTGLTVAAVTVQNEDGNTMPGFDLTWDANTEDDLIGYTLQIDAQTWDTGTESYQAATFADPLVKEFGLVNHSLVRTEFIAGVPYDFRLQARDAEGRTSGWSSVVTETAASDGTAPEVPDTPDVSEGFRLLGVRWDKNEEADLWFYQVRYYETASGVTNAVTLRVLASRIIIKDLTPDTEYTVQVRAVDRSGNVATSSADTTGVPFDENPDTGWSPAATGTPTKVGADDVAFNSVLTAILSTNVIDASTIETGDLSVGGSGMAGSIEVYDVAGDLLATLDADGLVMVNPNNTLQAMWLKAGSLKFTDAYTGDVTTTTWTTGVTPEGINASAITFGTEPGGANAVPNAGFELASFVVLSQQLWDDTPWGTPSSQVNLDTSGATLTMTSA